MAERLLEVKDLRVHFQTEEGTIPAINGVSLSVNKGETLGIVGESGSGKTITSLSIMRLIPASQGKVVSGEILFDGEDLLKKSEQAMQKIRGNKISMIFQEPMTSLNPVMTCGDQIAESIILHQGLSRRQSMEKATEMLRWVGVPMPERRVHEYPHQLSGGLRQRVMIAMALTCRPSLLIADEPTTALDVTIQAQIIELLKRLRQELGMSIILITHDLGVVAELADRVVVMYAGQVVEEADAVTLFRSPKHPYTEGLLKSIPRLDETRGRLYTIEGMVPHPLKMPKGCKFGPRCPYATDICREQEPPLEQLSPDRRVACWNHQIEKEGYE